MEKKLRKLRDDALAALRRAADPERLEALRVEYLGRSGKIRGAFESLKTAGAELRPRLGRLVNEIKEAVTGGYEEAKARLLAGSPVATAEAHDVTLPGRARRIGHRHPLTLMRDEIVGVFARLGFSVADGPEVETERYNFDALNTPADHPSRDAFDTFYVSPDSAGGATDVVLRSQTSTVQIRIMERRKPPLRVIAPGRVYRPDQVDATHHYCFHQIEGLAVDEGVSFADLKGVLSAFARGVFGEEARTRFRPSFFPFTEPSAEMDVSCIFCGGKGRRDEQTCTVCKGTGWIEIMGCGMVHPAVFEAVGVDAERFTGLAFGLGVERIAMLKWGVSDIRRFLENDRRFLEQFV